MAKKSKKKKPPDRSENEIRRLVLEYFYERYRKGRSARSDKTGVAAKISVVRRDLKDQHQLNQNDVWRALTYLISQKWIESEDVEKEVPRPGGTKIRQATTFYKITAAGIDKIEGPGEFTMPKFHGIKVEATGQNIITVGDGNQVDARFESVANGLAKFKEAVRASTELNDSAKLNIVADIDTIQNQLAKPEPNKSVIKTVWEGVKKVAAGTALAADVVTLSGVMTPLLS